MRVLQINTVHTIKSTGRTCSEVEKALIARGHECCTAYGNGPKDMGPGSYQIDTRAEYLFHNIMSRITGLEGYYSYFATRRLIRFIQSYKPDVIHLRNLHGHYLHLPSLFRFLAKSDIAVVQNLHDCWAFTGGCCHYTAQACCRWQTECFHCPKKKEYPQSYLFDFSRKARRDKEKWYASLKNLTVVGVSEWVSEQAKLSFLKNNEITYIYNWINRGIFHPYDDRDEMRNKYGIPQDKLMLISVSSQWSEGSPRYEDVVKLAERLGDDRILVLVGSASGPFASDKILHIPFVSDTAELAHLYSCADAYIHCSIEDTFGKVIAEAMACGTPVIVYNATACPELVRNGCGFAAEPRNVDQIVGFIGEIERNGKASYTKNCVDRVAENFDYQTNTAKLIELYTAVIERGKHGLQ